MNLCYRFVIKSDVLYALRHNIFIKLYTINYKLLLKLQRELFTFNNLKIIQY